MANTLGDILNSVAYRLGDNSYPTNASEQARWISYVKEALRNLYAADYFWFSEASLTMDSVEDQEIYDSTDGFDVSTIRDIIEVRVDDKVYTNVPQSKVFGLYDSTTALFNYEDLVSNKHWYVFGNELHILPAPSAAGTDNITVKYYSYPTVPTTTSSTFSIPDMFTDALVAYAFARVAHKRGRRGDAADGFAEFEEITKQLIAENNRRKFWGKSVRPIEPEFLVD